FLLAVSLLLSVSQLIPILAASCGRPSQQEFLEGVWKLFEGVESLKAVPVATGDYPLSKVSLHLVPEVRRYGEFSGGRRSASHLLQHAPSIVSVCGKNHELQVPISCWWAAKLEKAVEKVVNGLPRRPWCSGLRVESVARSKDVLDGAFDIIRVGTGRKDDEEVDRPLTTDGKLNPRKDRGHRKVLIRSLLSKQVEGRPQVSVAIDAVVIGQGNEVDPVATSCGSARLYESLCNRRQTLRL